MDSNNQSERDNLNRTRRVADNNAQNMVSVDNSVNVPTDNILSIDVSGNNANNQKIVNNSVNVTNPRLSINNINISGLDINRGEGSSNLGLPRITRQESNLLPPYSNSSDNIQVQQSIITQINNNGTTQNNVINVINKNYYKCDIDLNKLNNSNDNFDNLFTTKDSNIKISVTNYDSINEPSSSNILPPSNINKYNLLINVEDR